MSVINAYIHHIDLSFGTFLEYWIRCKSFATNLMLKYFFCGKQFSYSEIFASYAENSRFATILYLEYKVIPK